MLQSLVRKRDTEVARARTAAAQFDAQHAAALEGLRRAQGIAARR